jgi:predicted transcriptional regulator
MAPEIPTNLDSLKSNVYDDNIETQVMSIVQKLAKDNKIIDFNRIYHICLKELKLESEIILNALENLQQKRRIIFGQKIIRDLILNNLTRKIIYIYIKNNPGENFSTVLHQLNLNPKVLQWNLSMLLRYECIQEIQVLNVRIFGIYDQSPQKIILHYFTHNDKIRKILYILNQNPCQIQQLIGQTGLEYNFIFHQINNLLKQQLIIAELDKSNKIYKLNPQIISELQDILSVS